MAILIGDPHKPNTDTLIWAMPLEAQTWIRWQTAAVKFKCRALDIVYLNRMEGPGKRTIILLPEDWQSDEACETAAAWIRVVKLFEQRIYVVRSGHFGKGASIYAAAMTDTNHIEEVSESEFKKEPKP
jgi:hypothetical protein